MSEYSCGHPAKKIILPNNAMGVLAFLEYEEWQKDKTFGDSGDLCFHCWRERNGC